MAPCIIEPSNSDKNEQNIKILRRLSNSGDASKENKQVILELIHVTSSSIDSILKKIGLTKSEFKNNYTYHPNVPREFINEYTSEKTMNWIEKFLVPKSWHLYERFQKIDSGENEFNKETLKTKTRIPFSSN